MLGFYNYTVILTYLGMLVSFLGLSFAVGGIVNERENARVRKGEEMGRFELAGSTIVQFFEKDRVRLLDEVRQHVERNGEFRVRQGMWVGLSAVEHES